MYQRNLKAYQKAQVGTSKEKLLLMLYDGAIKFAETAKKAIEDGNVKVKGESVNNALAIVHELMNTLNHKVNPELCANLESLYLFISDELSDANINCDVAKIDSAVKILKTIREGFKDAAKSLQKAI